MKSKDPRIMFVFEGLKIRQIAALNAGKLGFSYSHLSKRSMREKWGDQRKAHRRNVAEGVEVASVIHTIGDEKLKSEVISDSMAEKLGELLGEKYASAKEQLLQTALLIDAEARKVLLADRIRITMDADGGSEAVFNTSLRDKAAAAGMHSVASASIRGLVPGIAADERTYRLQVRKMEAEIRALEVKGGNGTIDDPLDPGSAEFDAKMRERFGAAPVIYDHTKKDN